jgi:CRISPR-associated protein Csy3
MTTLQPSLLSYSRSLQVGKGLFYSISLNENGKEIKKPIIVEQIGVRGTQSTHSAGKGFYDENPDKPNLQRIEMASLPANSEIFECQFSLNVIGKSILPEACNQEEFLSSVKEFIDIYSEKKGFEFLSQLYIEQILNASWLWRNKEADDLIIHIKVMNRPEIFSCHDGKCSFILGAIRSVEQESFLKKLVNEFSSALKGDGMLRLEVSARGKIGFGQEIFPSQEFIEKAHIKDDIGRILAKTKIETGEDQAYLHPQKIGNALRTIDKWYSDSIHANPLPIEPYGVDSRRQKAMRAGKNKKIDFYSFIEKIPELTAEMKNVNSAGEINGNIHFVIACFIRGGVFSFSDPAKAEERKRNEAEKAAKKGMKENKKKIQEPEESMFAAEG